MHVCYKYESTTIEHDDLQKNVGHATEGCGSSYESMFFLGLQMILFN